MSFANNPVDFTSTINLDFLYEAERLRAINKPILSENISLPLLSITPTLSPSPSNPKPMSALFSLTDLEIACNIFKSSGLGLYLGKFQSRLQSNSITSQPISLKISGANIPAVPLPQATTAFNFLFILFLFIKSSLYTLLKFFISLSFPIPLEKFLFKVNSFNSSISSGA